MSLHGFTDTFQRFTSDHDGSDDDVGDQDGSRDDNGDHHHGEHEHVTTWLHRHLPKLRS